MQCSAIAGRPGCRRRRLHVPCLAARRTPAATWRGGADQVGVRCSVRDKPVWSAAFFVLIAAVARGWPGLGGVRQAAGSLVGSVRAPRPSRHDPVGRGARLQVPGRVGGSQPGRQSAAVRMAEGVDADFDWVGSCGTWPSTRGTTAGRRGGAR